MTAVAIHGTKMIRCKSCRDILVRTRTRLLIEEHPTNQVGCSLYVKGGSPVPQAAKRPCAGRHGCPSLVTHRQRVCPSCQTYVDQQRAEVQKYYDQFVRDPKLVAFYNSRAWISARDAVLVRDHALCRICFRKGELTQALIVHHIVEVRKDWSRRLDLGNLISVCQACHNRIHAK